jgi:uncharacterized protein YukE
LNIFVAAFEKIEGKMEAMNEQLNQLAETLKNVESKYFLSGKSIGKAIFYLHIFADAFEKIDSKMKAINETLSQKLTNVESKYFCYA